MNIVEVSPHHAINLILYFYDREKIWRMQTDVRYHTLDLKWAKFKPINKSIVFGQ